MSRIAEINKLRNTVVTHSEPCANCSIRLDKILTSMRHPDKDLQPFVGAPIDDVKGYIACRRKYEDIPPEMEEELLAKYTPPPPPELKLPKWKNPIKFADDVMVSLSVSDTVHVKLSVPFEEALPYYTKGVVIPVPVLVRCYKRCGAPDDILLGIIKRNEVRQSQDMQNKLQTAIDKIGKKNPIKKVLKSVKKNMIPK